MKKVAVVFNGGTISMKIDERIHAAVPSLSGEEIMSMVTGIEGYAKVECYNFSELPSPHVTPNLMLELSKCIKKLLSKDDIDGVVVTHGTDTLEETAYLLDLTIQSDKPVIVTGAMRSSSELGYDGPANLAASICTAISEDAKGRGVLVCFNGEVNSAREVTKANSMALNAFRTPNFGPIGIVDNNKVIFYRNCPLGKHVDIEKLERVGLLVGVAFQIQDDILDVIGDSKVIGKPVLSDEKNNKTTYVSIYGVEKSRQISRELMEEAMGILDYLGQNEFLKELFKSLIDREK